MNRNIVNILAKLPGVSGYSLYGVLHHPLEAVILSPARCVKSFWQRGRRGFSDVDCWNLGSYLNSWMPQAIRRLKNGHGYPGFLINSFDPTDEESKAAYATWQTMLEEMAQGFEASNALDEKLLPSDPGWEVAQQKVEKGMALFAKHHMALWD